jgi:hypothetical protein
VNLTSLPAEVVGIIGQGCATARARLDLFTSVSPALVQSFPRMMRQLDGPNLSAMLSHLVNYGQDDHVAQFIQALKSENVRVEPLCLTIRSKNATLCARLHLIQERFSNIHGLTIDCAEVFASDLDSMLTVCANLQSLSLKTFAVIDKGLFTRVTIPRTLKHLEVDRYYDKRLFLQFSLEDFNHIFTSAPELIEFSLSDDPANPRLHERLDSVLWPATLQVFRAPQRQLSRKEDANLRTRAPHSIKI